MSRNALYAVIAVLAVVIVGAGIYAYNEHEEDRNSLEIKVGPNGVKVDPPAQ